MQFKTIYEFVGSPNPFIMEAKGLYLLNQGKEGLNLFYHLTFLFSSRNSYFNIRNFFEAAY